MSKEKKERVLHTRIPQSLDNELKTRAEQLGMSVSNLVRNVLGHTFGMVGDIMADASKIRAAAQGDGPAFQPIEQAANGATEAAPRVLGWQEIVLQVNALCDKCNDILPRGTDAYLAVQTGPAQPVFRCQSCVAEIAHESSNEKHPEPV